MISNGKNDGNSNWKDLLTAYDGETITYDNSGNPISYYNGTRWALTWNNGRSLTRAVSTSTSVDFTYDLSGLRTSKTVGGVEHNYLYAGGKLMRESYGSNTLDFFYDANGTPYALKYNGTVYYYVTNLQGDVVRIVDASGNTVASYEYDPYGKVISATGTLAEVNPIRYRGYYYDNETGLYYLQSRYYDPAIGRFVNADNYASTGQGIVGNNMFAYCNNSPINEYDPNGHEPISLSILALCAIAALACTVIVAVGTKIISSIQQTSKAGLSEAKDNNSKKKPINLPSWKKLDLDKDHIFSGHMPDGPRNPNGNKTVFWGLTTSQVVKLIQEAYNHSSKIATVGDRIQLIGYSDTFSMAIEIWLNIAEKVIESAYPKG